MGERFLDEGVTPTTSQVYVLGYGPQPAAEQIEPFLLRVSYPVPWLQEINIVDTPGTNAIQHGSRGDPVRPVEVDFSLWPDRIEVAVRDRGPGFDPSLVGGDVTSPEHLLDSRGRGIFIMRACMDEVDFRFDAAGTTCLLVKRRPAAG